MSLADALRRALSQWPLHRPLSWQPRPCTHPRTVPVFDEAARSLPADEVRRRYPRFEGPCPDCGALVIGYASAAHCLAGDW